HNFTDDNGTLINGDGKAPLVLISSGSALYGTTMFGGSSGFGTVFRLSADGTGFRTLHTFAFTDSYAQSALLVSGNTLYGTIAYGGRSGTGRIFKVNTDGTSFATLYSFSAFITNSTGVYTNSDGNHPRGLISWGNMMYGTA